MLRRKETLKTKWEKYNAKKVTMKETDAEKEGDAENEKVEKKKTEIRRFILSRTAMWRLEQKLNNAEEEENV